MATPSHPFTLSADLVLVCHVFPVTPRWPSTRRVDGHRCEELDDPGGETVSAGIPSSHSSVPYGDKIAIRNSRGSPPLSRRWLVAFGVVVGVGMGQGWGHYRSEVCLLGHCDVAGVRSGDTDHCWFVAFP